MLWKWVILCLTRNLMKILKEEFVSHFETLVQNLTMSMIRRLIQGNFPIFWEKKKLPVVCLERLFYSCLFVIFQTKQNYLLGKAKIFPVVCYTMIAGAWLLFYAKSFSEKFGNFKIFCGGHTVKMQPIYICVTYFPSKTRTSC